MTFRAETYSVAGWGHLSPFGKENIEKLIDNGQIKSMAKEIKASTPTLKISKEGVIGLKIRSEPVAVKVPSKSSVLDVAKHVDFKYPKFNIEELKKDLEALAEKHNLTCDERISISYYKDR